MVALLNRLSAERIVLHEQYREDGRHNTISATAGGLERLRQMDAEVAAAQEDLLAPLDDGDRATLVQLLQRVVDHHHGRA